MTKCSANIFSIKKLRFRFFDRYIVELDTDDPKKIKSFARKFRWSIFWNKFTIIPMGIVKVKRLKSEVEEA